eukprot:7162624-Pyramimonas_sp.AAC.1
MIATRLNVEKHWHELGQHIALQFEGAPLLKYLGACYQFDEFNEAAPLAPRAVATEMSSYLRNV